MKAHFHESRAGGADGVVVAVAMFAGDDDLVGKAFAVRQSLHPRQIIAGQDRRGAERQSLRLRRR